MLNGLFGIAMTSTLTVDVMDTLLVGLPMSNLYW